MRLYKTIIASAIVMSAASCSSDEPSENIAANIAGTYSGYTVAESRYFNKMIALDQKISITSVSGDIANIKFTSTTWGTFEIPEAKVYADPTGVYTFEGNGKTVIGMPDDTTPIKPDGTTANTYDCTAKGKLSDGKISVAFKMPSVMNGFTIEFFEGTAPATYIISGQYDCTGTGKSNYFTQNFDDQSVTIEAIDDTKIKLVYEGSPYGIFSTEDTEVTYDEKNKIATITGNGEITMGMGTAPEVYPFTLSGTVSDDQKDVEFIFSIPDVMGGLTVTLH